MGYTSNAQILLKHGPVEGQRIIDDRRAKAGLKLRQADQYYCSPLELDGIRISITSRSACLNVKPLLGIIDPDDGACAPA
jgi:hypothetical protein